MEQVTIKPAHAFTIQEILDKFEEIENSKTFKSYLFTEQTRTSQVINPDYQGEDDEPFIEKTHTEQKHVVSKLGAMYGFKHWVERILTDNPAMKPVRMQDGEKTKVWLHSQFQWCSEKGRGGENYDPDAGKKEINKESIIKWWLGCQFGFFKWKGSVVQINPAYLFLLQFLPEQKQQAFFAGMVSEARVIADLNEEKSEWALNRFEYYLNAICGNRHHHALEDREGYWNFRKYQDHWLLRDLPDTRYCLGKAMYKDDVLKFLPELGNVPFFGYSAKSDQMVANLIAAKEYSNIHDLNENLIRNPQFNNESITTRVFSKGGYLRVNHYKTDFVAKDSDIEVSTTGLLKYFNALARRYKNDLYCRPISKIKDDMIKFGYFEEATVRKKLFIKEYLIPRMKTFGFKVEEGQKTMDDLDGKKGRTLFVTAPRYKKGGNK